MNFGEEIAQKRQSMKDKRTETVDKLNSQLTHAKSTDASAQVAIASAKAIIKSLAVHEPNVTIKNLPDLATAQDAKKLAREIDTLAKAIKQSDVATNKLLTGTFKELGNKVSTIPSKFSSDDITKALAGLNKELIKLNKRKEPSNKDVVEAAKKIEAAINKLKLDPKVQVDVKAPSVTVPKIDTSGIEAVLSRKEPEKFDFSDYYAQDIDNDSEVFQYVGLMTPTGEWCVIQNDFSSLRFSFGSKGYEKAWKNHVGLKYSLFDEAINEAKA